MRLVYLVAALSLSLAGTGGVASAQEQLTGEDLRARTHFDAGRQHYEEGAYDRALVEFQRAWELSHRPVLLINLATVEERLGMYEEAANHLREFIRLEPGSPEVERFQTRITNLERLHAERGSAEAPSAGGAPVAGGAVSSSSGPDGALLGGAIAGFGVAVVGGVMIGVFGGLALGADASLANGCGATGSCTDAEVADANTFALVSDVGIGVLGAGVVAGTVLLILALTSSSGSESAAVLRWLAPNGVRGSF